MEREEAKNWTIIGLVVIIVVVFLTQPIRVTEVETFDWVTSDDMFVIGELTIADPDDATQDQSRPDIYGDLIVFDLEIGSSNHDIAMYDISEDKITIIENNTAEQYFPTIHDDKIVWMDARSGDYDIYMKDLSSNATTLIVSTPSDEINPIIFNDKIVYYDLNSLWLHDLNTGTGYEIHTGHVADYDIYENYVIYIPTNTYNILLHNISDNTTNIVIVDEGAHFPTNIKIHEDNVVYQAHIEGTWTTKYYSIEANRTYPIQPSWDAGYFPDIYGDLIVTLAEYSWSYDSQVTLTYIPDEPFSETATIITNNTEIKGNAHITDSYIIWEEYGAIEPFRSSSATEHDIVFVSYAVNEDAELIQDVTYTTTYNTEWIGVLIILGLMLGLTTIMYTMTREENYE